MIYYRSLKFQRNPLMIVKHSSLLWLHCQNLMAVWIVYSNPHLCKFYVLVVFIEIIQSLPSFFSPTVLARKPNLEKNYIYSNKFFHNFHLSESSFTCAGLIEVPVPSQESELSCICVLRASIFVSFYDFAIGFWNCSDSVV